MADQILSKLLEADADLEAQEAKLIAQLEKIQTQRTSLQSVLEMFEQNRTVGESTNEVVVPTDAAANEVAVEPSAKTPVEAPSTTRKSASKSTQPRKTATTPKSTRRGWQKYMREEYGQTPLPEVVERILRSKPNKEFGIKEILNTIVVEEIPSTARKDARNRISNILAEGARKNLWDRPRAGCYRLSK